MSGIRSGRKLTAATLVALAASVVLTASAPGGGPAGVAFAGGSDTTPPDPYIRTAKRQELGDVLKRGIQATCGTEDDERPVECTMSATRRGKLLASETDDIVAPFNRVQFHLELSAKDERKFRKEGAPIEIKLELEVADEAGNVGTDRRPVRLVEDRFKR